VIVGDLGPRGLAPSGAASTSAAFNRINRLTLSTVCARMMIHRSTAFFT